MNVVHPVAPFVQDRDRIGPGKMQVAGIIQKRQIVRRPFHQPIDVLGVLHHGAHMVAIAQIHTLIAGPFGHL